MLGLFHCTFQATLSLDFAKFSDLQMSNALDRIALQKKKAKTESCNRLVHDLSDSQRSDTF